MSYFPFPRRSVDLTVFKMVAVRHLGFVVRVLGQLAMNVWWYLLLRKIC